jgi:hypothetical protein
MRSTGIARGYTGGTCFGVVIAQFDGSTTMRPPPLAAGLLAATLRREPELGAMSIRVLAARREPDAAAGLVADADVAGDHPQVTFAVTVRRRPAARGAAPPSARRT